MESHQQGIRLLEQILEEKTWDLFTNNDIKHSDFYADSAQVLIQINKYHKTYSELPPKDVLISKVKENCLGLHNFEFPEKIAKEAVIDTFFEHKISRDFSQIMSQGKRLRLEDGVTEAANYIKKALAELERCGKKEDTLNFAENAQERLKKYNNKKWETSSCILSPWDYFNNTLDGWDIAEANHVIAGVSSVGKSWAGCVSALHAAFQQDKKVLLISKENGIGSILDRLDSVYAKLPYGKRRRGELEVRSYNEYLNSIKNLAGEKGQLFIEADERKTQTVDQIHELSERHQCDLVIVDGAYLVKSSSNFDNDTSNQKNLANEFQRASISQPKTAWVTILQLAPEAGEITSGKEQAFKIRGCREWFITAASVLAMTASPENRLQGVVKIAFGKGREMAEAPDRDFFYIKDDKVNSDFSEVDMSLFDDEELAELV